MPESSRHRNIRSIPVFGAARPSRVSCVLPRYSAAPNARSLTGPSNPASRTGQSEASKGL